MNLFTGLEYPNELTIGHEDETTNIFPEVSFSGFSWFSDAGDFVHVQQDPLVVGAVDEDKMQGQQYGGDFHDEDIQFEPTASSAAVDVGALRRLCRSWAS